MSEIVPPLLWPSCGRDLQLSSVPALALQVFAGFQRVFRHRRNFGDGRVETELGISARRYSAGGLQRPSDDLGPRFDPAQEVHYLKSKPSRIGGCLWGKVTADQHAAPQR